MHFVPKNNKASQSRPTVQLAVLLCACTGLLVQHYSNCACTGLLVQHSLIVITINSSLTQCTVGAVQRFTNVYAIL